MLFKQCPQCEHFFSIRKKLCPQCGQRVTVWQFLKIFFSKTRLRLAMLTIILILIVGLGWFLRMESGSRWPLFIVFFLLAPLVPWILKLAYKHAAPQEVKENDTKTE